MSLNKFISYLILSYLIINMYICMFLFVCALYTSMYFLERIKIIIIIERSHYFLVVRKNILIRKHERSESLSGRVLAQCADDRGSIPGRSYLDKTYRLMPCCDCWFGYSYKLNYFRYIQSIYVFTQFTVNQFKKKVNRLMQVDGMIQGSL